MLYSFDARPHSIRLAAVRYAVAVAVVLLAVLPTGLLTGSSVGAAWAQSPGENSGRGVALSLQASSNGPGLGLHTRLAQRLQVRLAYTHLPMGHTVDVEQNGLYAAADARVRLGGAALWVDWYPFGGAFHLSGGAMAGSPRAEARVRPTQDYVYSERKTFSPERVGSLSATARYSAVSPYVGAGWGDALDDRWSLMVDVGAYYLGRPRLDLEATGLIAPTARQEARLEERLSSFRYLPVVSLALAYRL
jgi:hypothetical protein